MPFVAKNPNQNFFWIPLNYILILKILTETFFKEHAAAILTMKSYRKPPVTMQPKNIDQ
jgi:hypothetical protein